MRPDIVPDTAHVSAGRPNFDPVRRGYHIMYRINESNHCPGCGRSHWIIGRLLAECAFCGTALPLECYSGCLSGQPRFTEFGTPGYMAA